MRPDLSELHIYLGILAASVGAAIAFGPGIGLIVLGLGLIPSGIVIAKAPQPQAPARPFDAMITTSPDADDEAA